MPVRSALKFARLAYYSIRYFTDVPYMLVFMNNQSNLETRKALVGISKNHQVWCFEDNTDFNKSRIINTAMRHCFQSPEVKYGLVIDSDVVVEPEWLSGLLATLNSQEESGIVSPRMNAKPAVSFGDVTGTCMLFRREVFERLRGFDEVLFDGEQDMDFCARAEEIGFRSATAENVRIHHFGGATVKALQHQLKSVEETSKEVFVKHPVKEGDHVRV